jgi:succinoglycan biosynthesis transport protein ExoP
MASHDPGSADSLQDSAPSADSKGNGNNTGNDNGSVTGALTTIDHRVQQLPAVGFVHGTPHRPEILSAKPNPVELLHAVRRRWTLAIGMGITAGTIVAALLWFLIPVRYEAFALLKVSSRPQTVLTRSVTGANDEFTVFKRTQVQLILTGSVLQRTVTEPEISRLSIMQEHNEEPLTWLKKQLLIEYPDDAEVMRISLKTPKANEAKKIVDMVVTKYLSEIVQHDRDLRNDHQRKLEQAYETYSGEVKTQTDTLHKLELLHKTSSTEAAQVRRKVEIERLGELLSQRSRLEYQRTENSMAIMLMEARRDNADILRPSDAMIDVELSKDPSIAKLTEALSQWNEALVDAVGRTRHPETSSTIRKLKDKISRTEEMLEERKANLIPKLREIQLASASSSSQQLSLPLLEKQREHLDIQFKKAEDDVKAQTEVLEKLEDFNVNVQSKLEELKAWRTITADLRAEVDRIKVERLAPERITKIDDASIFSNSGDALAKYLAVAFAALLSFAAVVVGVAFVEFQSRKVNNVHEVHDGLGIRVLGELPNVSGRTWRRIKGGKGPALLKNLMAERIDGARTNMIHTTAIQPPRVVLVTSAEPHEGKTTTATQLAASLARSGRRTLLIDADIRNPGAHRVFEMPSEPGLCELLRGEADRESVVHPTRTANLWLLSAGRCDLHSVQALSTTVLGTTIDGLCTQFDYVVIDSGPVLKVADPLMVGQHVDAAILSVLRDASKVPNVYEACERLRSVGIVVLGAVVNGVNDDVARHGVELLMAESTAQATAQSA